MDWEFQHGYKKRGVIMRVHPEFKAFCEEKSSEYGIPQTEFTKEVVKKIKRGIITWI